MPAANPTLSSSHLLAPALPSFMPPALQSFMPRAIDGSSAAYATSTALPAAALVSLWCCRHWWRPRSYGCSWCYQGETSKQFNTCKIKYLSQFYITLTIPQLLATVVCKTIIEDNKKCRQTAGDFGYNEGCIAQWSTSRASLEATGCWHWLSVCAVSPRRPPWSTNLNERYILIASCLWEFWDPKRTLYSAHQYDKLCLNVKCHDWNWRAQEHF